MLTHVILFRKKKEKKKTSRLPEDWTRWIDWTRPHLTVGLPSSPLTPAPEIYLHIYRGGNSFLSSYKRFFLTLTNTLKKNTNQESTLEFSHTAMCSPVLKKCHDLPSNLKVFLFSHCFSPFMQFALNL